jgi:hypothetical protein
MGKLSICPCSAHAPTASFRNDGPRYRNAIMKKTPSNTSEIHWKVGHDAEGSAKRGYLPRTTRVFARAHPEGI